MNEKIRSRSLAHLDSRKRSPTRNNARAAAEECMSSEDGDVVNRVMVVEIKSFAVVKCICKLRLHLYTSQTRTLKTGDASHCQLHH